MLVSATSMLNNAPSYFEENYTNLVFAKVNFTQFFAAIPASKFWSSNEIIARYGLENIGDVLRVVLVLLFGGTYFDTDVISLKTIPDQEKVCKCMFFTCVRIKRKYSSYQFLSFCPLPVLSFALMLYSKANGAS